LFTSREYDRESNLYYYRARYYDANLGRFISQDPIWIADDINLYNYVGGNPVNWADPLGLEKSLWEDIRQKINNTISNLWGDLINAAEQWWTRLYKNTPELTALGGAVWGIAWTILWCVWWGYVAVQTSAWIATIFLPEVCMAWAWVWAQQWTIWWATAWFSVGTLWWAIAAMAKDAKNSGKGDNPLIWNTKKLPDDEILPPKKRWDAPISKKDGKPVNIHHENQNPEWPFSEKHFSNHKNIPNKKPSQITPEIRKHFNKFRKKYRENERDNWRFNNFK